MVECVSVILRSAPANCVCRRRPLGLTAEGAVNDAVAALLLPCLHQTQPPSLQVHHEDGHMYDCVVEVLCVDVCCCSAERSAMEVERSHLSELRQAVNADLAAVRTKEDRWVSPLHVDPQLCTLLFCGWRVSRAPVVAAVVQFSGAALWNILLLYQILHDTVETANGDYEKELAENAAGGLL